MSFYNPWKTAKAFRRGFENACKKIDKLEERIATLEAASPVIVKIAKDLVKAEEDRTKAFADYARERNWGIDAELTELGL